jgi:hypothetical protein
VVASACWTGSSVSEPNVAKRATAAKPGARERRAVLRVDPEPGARKFQGVWLEIGAEKWVVDYRVRPLWKWFADREVTVTGSCYQPEGAAIMGPHFHVDTLHVVDRRGGAGPYFGFGPERELAGELVVETGKPGSKAAGSSWDTFLAEDGTHYGIEGEFKPPYGLSVRVRARVLEPDLSYVARVGNIDVWIIEQIAEGSIATPRNVVPCPDGT